MATATGFCFVLFSLIEQILSIALVAISGCSIKYSEKIYQLGAKPR